MSVFATLSLSAFHDAENNLANTFVQNRAEENVTNAQTSKKQSKNLSLKRMLTVLLRYRLFHSAHFMHLQIIRFEHNYLKLIEVLKILQNLP
jgi:hypothetical protein